MADETYLSKVISQINKGKSEIGEAVLAEVVGPGNTMRIHTDGLIYATKLSDSIFSGTILNGKDDDLDTDYAVGDIVSYAKAGSGIDVAMKLKGLAGPVAVLPGNIAQLSDTDDLICKFVSQHSLTGDAQTLSLDTILDAVVGRFMEYDAGHATEIRIVLVKLSL